MGANYICLRGETQQHNSLTVTCGNCRRAARQLDTLMQALTVPLSRYLREFPAPEALHAFERALLELSVGEERYVAALHRVAELRKPLSEVRQPP